MQEIDEDSELVQKLRGVEEELKVLAAELDEPGRREREERALERISRNISHYSKFMTLERSGDIINLRVKDLTLTFESETRNRVDLLWEIGSGANWMGYHVAALLGIHEYLLDHAQNGPVPSFLVVDQPSQVYFPSDYFARQEKENEVSLGEQDLIATRRIFEALSEGVLRMAGRIQVIVTEHADESAWVVSPE